MPNWDFATGTVALPVWAVGVTLFVGIGVLTLTRAGADLARALLRVATVVVAFTAACFWLSQTSLSERAAERRALDERISDLNSRAVSPGSALACLDAGAGDTVESACEAAVFATPQSVAGAVTYVSARLALLADATDFARRTGSNYESAIAPLRLAIETDRFGLVAHVLSVRDSCTPLLCDSYMLLHDPDRVQANLRERLFERYVDRYAPKWAAQAQAPSTPVADASASSYASASALPVPAASAMPVRKYDFPSAASIPPVSIMNDEPGAPPEPKSEAKADAKPDGKPDAKPDAKPDTKADTKAGSAPGHRTAQHPPPARATAARTPPTPPITPPASAAPAAPSH